MFIDFSSIYSSGCFADGKEKHQKRETISLGLRMSGWFDTVNLATGESLRDIRGSAILHRGDWEDDSLGQLTYVPEFSDSDHGHSEACYQLDLFLRNSMFEKVLRNVEQGRLPRIQTTIQWSLGEENVGIKYGSLPDGSLMIWDNEKHSHLPIVGYEMRFDFVPKPEEPLDDDDETLAPSLPPTAQQLDKIISEIDRLKANTKSIASALMFLLIIWAVVTVFEQIF